MRHFALLLNHAPDRYTGLSHDSMMDIIKDYVAWVEDLSAKGIYQGGHKLIDTPGQTLTCADGGITVTDAPFAEVSEILGGLMIIAAEDMDAATAIAKTCPHLVHNSTLEIREVDQQVE